MSKPLDHLRKIRVIHRNGRTLVTDVATGEQIRHITSLELFQVGEQQPMFASIKIVGVVECVETEAEATVEEVKA
jgi:hypothetical protein